MTAAIDSDTIATLQRGTCAEERTHLLVLTDCDGRDEAIPVAVRTERDGTTRVEVLRDVLDEVDRLADGPRRRAGLVELGDLASLIAYVNRFKRAQETVAFASADPPEIAVVFDYDGPSLVGGPEGDNGWRGDRAVYRCPLSRQWKLWAGLDGQPMGQVAFGDLLEQNADDIRAGADDHAPAARMLEVARNLVINSVGKFARSVDPNTGTGTLTIVDDHDKATSTKIPRAFGLAIPVFEGSPDLYAVEARIRFAMVDAGGGAKRPSFTFILHNRAQVFEAALAAVRKTVEASCAIPVYVGKAPAPAVVR